MDISNNSSSVARSCWKKFYWRYNEKLTPIRQAPALTLGRVVHEAFDLYYKGTPVQEILVFIKKTFDEEISRSAPDESEYLVIQKFTALGMFGHCNFLDKDKFEKIESEKEFRMKLMPGVWFTGRLDGLVKTRGVWWVRELKTTSQSQRQFHQRCESSSQGTAYVWAMRKLGYDVKGIMYEFIKKPLLRKRVSEDQFEFGSRILGDYKKKPTFYFGQIYSYRNDIVVNEWEKDAISLAKEILRKKKSGEYYRNTNACFSYNSECPYKKICFEEKPDNLMLQLYFKKDGCAIDEKGGAIYDTEETRQDSSRSD
jgi:hypothetical protein